MEVLLRRQSSHLRRRCQFSLQKLEEERVKVFIGDQGDKAFLNRLAREIPRIDVLIDDGGHFMEQQINTFEVLYPLISPRGVYLCEDLHTSYWRRGYNGGRRRRGTFIEHAKRLIDGLNEWHYGKRGASEFTRSTDSMHFYDSILVIEKRPRSEPRGVGTGSQQVQPHSQPVRFWHRARKRLAILRPW